MNSPIRHFRSDKLLFVSNLGGNLGDHVLVSDAGDLQERLQPGGRLHEDLRQGGQQDVSMVCVEVAEGREQAWSEVRSDDLKEVIGEHRLLHGSEVRGARWRFTGPPMPLAGA